MKFLPVLFLVLLAQSVTASPRITINGSVINVEAPGYSARFDGPSLVYFRDSSTGEVLVNGAPSPLPVVRLIENARPLTIKPARLSDFSIKHEAASVIKMECVVASTEKQVNLSINLTLLDSEIHISGKADTKGKAEGTASIGLAVGPTAPQTEVLVPHSGGLAFKSSEASGGSTFEWPITWEAAMVQIQGKKGGLLAAAFEPFKRFKNLELSAGKKGYNLLLETENPAPFEGKKGVHSLEWSVRPYQGGWRSGAQIYRDWLQAAFKPDINEDPAWVKDIRAEVHCGMELDLLDAMVQYGLDPKQTLLYVPSWRTNEYDRNYPDYSPSEKLKPFISKAHELGFRIMLHVNYFGCDPKMPEYQRFEKYQFRTKYSGDKQWWHWTRAEPEIKFAYINPASREWRSFFIEKMVQLIKETGTDSLHLDQTLCIFNDKNGLIDGLNSAEGNLLLHKELKQALPDVAISGEGLDEVTMIHEAFVQRHAYGIDFVNQSFNRMQIEKKHPLCAYLFGDRTRTYPYLGTCSPDNDQVFLAWRDFYRVGGVLPGYPWLSKQALLEPSPLGSQTLEEMLIFQKYGLDPDMEGDWPEEVNFPYRSRTGSRFAYVDSGSGWSLSQLTDKSEPDKEFTRTITGTRSVDLSGSIPGWICYDNKSINCLDPQKYYVYSIQPGDESAFHLEPVGKPFKVASSAVTADLVWVRLESDDSVTDISHLLPQSEQYCITGDGRRLRLSPEVTEQTGSTVQPRGDAIFIHPPWKGNVPKAAFEKNGYGTTVMKCRVTLPKDVKSTFHSTCALDPGADGKSDGVVFTVNAECEGKRLTADVFADSQNPQVLTLDLSELAGKSVDIELTAASGPKHDASFDWGLIYRPRIEHVDESELRCRVVWPANMKHFLPSGKSSDGVYTVSSGSALMAAAYEAVKVERGTVELSKLPVRNHVRNQISTVDETGKDGLAGSSPESVGGVVKTGIFAHPPPNGQRQLHYFISAPERSKVSFNGFVGLKDGSKSAGVRFEVWVNGKRIWSESITPKTGWKGVKVDLGDQVSSPFMLTLVTDSEGSHYYDWALWGEPRIEVE